MPGSGISSADRPWTKPAREGEATGFAANPINKGMIIVIKLILSPTPLRASAKLGRFVADRQGESWLIYALVFDAHLSLFTGTPSKSAKRFRSTWLNSLIVLGFGSFSLALPTFSIMAGIAFIISGIIACIRLSIAGSV
jgi:hypothetical protein